MQKSIRLIIALSSGPAGKLFGVYNEKKWAKSPCSTFIRLNWYTIKSVSDMARNAVNHGSVILVYRFVSGSGCAPTMFGDHSSVRSEPLYLAGRMQRAGSIRLSRQLRTAQQFKHERRHLFGGILVSRDEIGGRVGVVGVIVFCQHLVDAILAPIAGNKRFQAAPIPAKPEPGHFIDGRVNSWRDRD